MRRLLVLFFLFIFSVGCKTGSTPEGIIPEDKMVNVLTDMHLADGYTSSIIDTTLVITTYKSLYKTYDIDSASFKKSLEFYAKDPIRLKAMYAQVAEKLGKLEKFEQKKEQIKIKKQQQRDKFVQDSIAKREKFKKDSLKRDSIKKVQLKKATLKKDSIKRDSVKKSRLEKKLRLKKDKK